MDQDTHGATPTKARYRSYERIGTGTARWVRIPGPPKPAAPPPSPSNGRVLRYVVVGMAALGLLAGRVAFATLARGPEARTVSMGAARQSVTATPTTAAPVTTTTMVVPAAPAPATAAVPARAQRGPAAARLVGPPRRTAPAAPPAPALAAPRAPSGAMPGPMPGPAPTADKAAVEGPSYQTILPASWWQPGDFPALYQFRDDGTGVRTTYPPGNPEFGQSIGFTWSLDGPQLTLKFPNFVDLMNLQGYSPSEDRLAQTGSRQGPSHLYGCHSGHMPDSQSAVCSS